MVHSDDETPISGWLLITWYMVIYIRTVCKNEMEMVRKNEQNKWGSWTRSSNELQDLEMITEFYKKISYIRWNVQNYVPEHRVWIIYGSVYRFLGSQHWVLSPFLIGWTFVWEHSLEYSLNCGGAIFGVQKVSLNMFWDHSPNSTNTASDWLRAELSCGWRKNKNGWQCR